MTLKRRAGKGLPGIATLMRATAGPGPARARRGQGHPVAAGIGYRSRRPGQPVGRRRA